MKEKKWEPAYYDDNSVMQYNTALEMLKTITISENDEILDVGCGSGKISAEMAKRAKKVVGIDISPEMVEFASQNYPFKNLSFIVGDVTTFNINKKFDLIVSFWTLSWVKDQEKALRNIITHLKEGGSVLLMYPMRHDVYDIINSVVERDYWKPKFNNFKPRPFISEEKFRSVLQGLPLQGSCIKKEISCKFENMDEMQKSIRTWIRHIDELDIDSEKSKFIKEVASEYLYKKDLADPVMSFSVLEFYASKKNW
ncbi:MAG: methyltransferase domain-containing protein [Gammaproteobacteria bacterium]